MQEVITLDGSEEDGLILGCARLGEVAWAGTTRGARLALKVAFALIFSHDGWCAWLRR